MKTGLIQSALGLCCAASCLGGCASDDPVPADAQPLVSAAPTPVRGGQNGIEVRFWPVASDATVEEELRRLEAQPLSVDPSARARWTASGLRVLAVPIEQVERLTALLSIAPAEQAAAGTPVVNVSKRWVPQGPLWIEAVRGPVSTMPRAVGLHDSRLPIGSDAVRLLVRCWTVPVPPGEGQAGMVGGAVRVEMVPQVLDRSQRSTFDPLGPEGERRGEEYRGLIISRLALTTTLAPNTAILITTDPPTKPPDPQSDAPQPKGPVGVVERREGESSNPPPPSRRPSGQETDARGPQPLGPSSDVVATLGQAMLTYTAPGGKPTRAVVLLIPHAPDRFGLLGR